MRRKQKKKGSEGKVGNEDRGRREITKKRREGKVGNGRRGRGKGMKSK